MRWHFFDSLRSELWWPWVQNLKKRKETTKDTKHTKRRKSEVMRGRGILAKGALSTLNDLMSAQRNCGKLPEWRNFFQISRSTVPIREL